MQDIIGNGISVRGPQRKDQRFLCFALHDRYRILFPVDILQFQKTDIDSPESCFQKKPADGCIPFGQHSGCEQGFKSSKFIIIINLYNLHFPWQMHWYLHLELGCVGIPGEEQAGVLTGRSQSWPGGISRPCKETR